jgi:hypothetical protein
MDVVKNLNSNFEMFKSKWNQRYLTNIQENDLFKSNNRGVSHLTSPMNYVQDETIKNIVSSNKAFLLQRLNEYKSKLQTVSLPTSPSITKRKNPKL